MFNSSTSLVPATDSLKVYLKIPSFLFYINDLVTTLNNDAVIALFADDVSVFITARKREDAEATAQSVVSSVVTWSQEWKLNLNAEKRGMPLLYLV